MQRLFSLIPPGITRIDLLAPPFSGHLHPVLALGRALSDHYQVRIISTHGASISIQAAGLDGLILKGDFDAPLLAITNPQHAIGSNPVRLYRQFRGVVRLLNEFANELERTWSRQGAPDLAIADFTLPVVAAVCCRLNVIWWTSLPSPCVLETTDGPPAYCGGLMPATNAMERLMHMVHRKKVRLFKRTIFWMFRNVIRQTGITQLYRLDGTESAYSPNRILALSEKEMEFTRSWPASVAFIGPALYTPPSNGVKPPFVKGKRHVLITLGTHLDWHKNDVARAVDALAKTMPDWEFHFTDGSLAVAEREHSGNFWRSNWIDYDLWLSHYDVVIHHGGAGIMWHCIQKEIPALVYPVDYDQFDHAARIVFFNKGIWLRGGLEQLKDAREHLIQLTHHRYPVANPQF
ncbi:glycosyl transferase [Enterobacter cloacae subsp. cloacae]|uniref:glycosyltransferase n=1 Tax=Enterobacter cloacae TaxID=550 RepID=UPI00063AB488|nr:glycosyl transferase [Enterobacter cloacae]KLG14307.1 glycosyl transferase [Enterobacter cloacae subsp. cloacae]